MVLALKFFYTSNYSFVIQRCYIVSLGREVILRCDIVSLGREVILRCDILSIGREVILRCDIVSLGREVILRCDIVSLGSEVILRCDIVSLGREVILLRKRPYRSLRKEVVMSRIPIMRNEGNSCVAMRYRHESRQCMLR